jgi:hypothetical protein
VAAFGEAYRSASVLLVGGDGIELEVFLEQPIGAWFP